MTKLHFQFRTIRGRTIAILLAATMIALVIYTLVALLTDWSVNRWYLSEAAQHRRNDALAEHLQEDCARASIASDDAEALEAWVNKRAFVSLVVLLPGHPFEIDAWGIQELPDEEDLAWRLNDQDYDYYTLTFADGERTVAISESSEYRLNQIGRYVALAAAIGALMAIMLTHSRWITRRISVLSKEVNAVSHGEIEHEIVPVHRDEISSLAADVEYMRSTIIQRTRSEQSALQANSELITALSHDIRNPLTALIGYLELLEMDLDALPETDREYVRACLDKSYRIRDLTGEMFRYFLVYNKEAQTADLEDYDAQVLLWQLLGEHAEDLKSRGFAIETATLETPCMLHTDVNLLKRVVDNLTSNIVKYADPDEPVRIEVSAEGLQLSIRFTNRVAALRPGVESNHVGLRTCDAIMRLLGGSFRTQKEDDTFLAECILPVKNG